MRCGWDAVVKRRPARKVSRPTRTRAAQGLNWASLAPPTCPPRQSMHAVLINLSAYFLVLFFKLCESPDSPSGVLSARSRAPVHSA